jgi:hypothetical protein
MIGSVARRLMTIQVASTLIALEKMKDVSKCIVVIPQIVMRKGAARGTLW